MSPTCIKKRSKVWQLFVPVVPGETARCVVCDAVLKTSGGSTSGLAKHLLTSHNDEWSAIDSDVEEGSVVEISFQETIGSLLEKKRKSHVWEYCVPSKEFRETAECKICGVMLKTTGSSTSSLTRHLATAHKIYKGGNRSSEAEASNLETPTVSVAENIEAQTDAAGEFGDEDTIENEEEMDSKNSEDARPSFHDKTGLSSPVWKYFVPSACRTTASCTICHAVLKTTDRSTTLLARHLVSQHHIVGERVKKERNDGDEEDSENNDDQGIVGARSHQARECDEGEDFENERSEGIRLITLPKRRSYVWKFFTRTSIKNKPKCKLCGVFLSSNDGSTSTLRRHLMSKHNLSGEKAEETRSKQDDDETENTGNVSKVEARKENQEGDVVVLDTVEEMLVEDSDDGEFWTPGSERKARKKLPKRQKSQVWKYFVKLNKEKSKCKICGILSSSKCGSTSALARHLASRHNIGENRDARKKFRVVIKTNTHKTVDSDGIQDDDGEIDGDIRDISTEQYSFYNQISCEDEEDVKRRSNRSATRSQKTAEYGQPIEDTCFVCHTEFNRKSVPPCHQEEYHFLLKEMLQIPIGKSMDYLDQLGRPEKWICLCKSCRSLVGEGLSARAKIIHLQLQLEKFQGQILKKITSCKPVNDSANYRYPRKQRQIVDDIKKYVNSRMYSVVNYEDDVDKVNDDLDPVIPSSLDSDCENNASDGVIDTSQIQCGLCNDDKVYESVALLAAHTGKCHQEQSSSSKRFKAGIDNERELNHLIASKSKHCRSSQYCYQCPNCPKVKQYPLAKFILHLAIHQKRPYQCTVCSEFLPTDEYLQECHWNEKHANFQLPPDANKFVKIKLCLGRIWKCDSCLDGFFSEEDRDDHEVRCIPRDQQRLWSSLPLTRRKPHQCLLCDLRFRNVAEWRIHRALKHPELDCKCCYYCDECFYETTVEGLEARHDQKMVDHMTTEHLSKRLYIDCEPCGLVFDSGREHKEHMAMTHGLPIKEMYVCLVCGINYNDVVTLRQHMHIVHFQSGLSVCDMCGVNFLKLELLHHHKFISHGILPEGREVLNCPKEGCNFQGIFKQKIQQHVRRVHDAKKQTFTCRFCRKTFKERSKLNLHLEIHMNKDTKPYQCEVCGHGFAVKSYLLTHKKLKHEGRMAPNYNRKRKYKSGEEVKEPPPSKSSEVGQAVVTSL